MTLQDYIKLTKKELDEMEKQWIEENKKNPELWPLEMDIGQWGEHELISRSGQK